MRLIFWILAALLFHSEARAQSAQRSPGHNLGSHLGVGLMMLGSSTQQGGQGPTGSTTLTHAEYVYNWSNHLGFGLFYLMDKQGSSETDTAIGPKIELQFRIFYLDIGYAPSVTRAYTDRSIANETGTGMYYGLGTRFNLGGPGGGGRGGGFYFFANYKFRTYTIDKQDGTALSEKIIQKDNYPIFGVGYHF